MNARLERRLGAIEQAVNATDATPALSVVYFQNEDGAFSVDGAAPFYATHVEVIAAIEQRRGIRVCGCVCVAPPPPLPDEDREEVST